MTNSRHERRPAPRPVVLCILDGWGHRAEEDHNAIAKARTPVYDRLLREAPHALLDTSGEQVGLPAGQMGNSEVGHMNLGGGRVVVQDLPRIDAAIESGDLAANETLLQMAQSLKKSGGTCHLMGLMSPGGVHSHQSHIAALARTFAEAGVSVAVHAFLDGRDTPPRSALRFVQAFERSVADLDNVFIATVTGRYYAMDRDKRWDRIEAAYDALTSGEGRTAASANDAIEKAYDAGENDEFVKPTVVDGYAGMADGDGLIMANFRADRARQILHALVDPDFDNFRRKRMVDFAAKAGMVEYSTALSGLIPALFPPESLTNTLGEFVAEHGLRQLRIAETEKYAHVTFFLNGGREAQFDGEERILIPSPKVATYDLQPEMSAHEVTDKLVAAIDTGKFDLIVVNYANGDMVGHTGVMDAAVKAVETVDDCLGRLEEAITKAGGVMLITADHGNVELMTAESGDEPHTAHTTFAVPIILVNTEAVGVGHVSLHDGRLADVAPTVLNLMGFNAPPEMTGRSLLDGTDADVEREARATV